jgi:hypothetical protein
MVKKKKIEGKPIIKRGRPPVWGPEKKYNKTIRLSESQEIKIYSNFPTLQAYFEHTYVKFIEDLKKKKVA